MTKILIAGISQTKLDVVRLNCIELGLTQINLLETINIGIRYSLLPCLQENCHRFQKKLLSSLLKCKCEQLNC